jgi:hypothetical protein
MTLRRFLLHLGRDCFWPLHFVLALGVMVVVSLPVCLLLKWIRG